MKVTITGEALIQGFDLALEQARTFIRDARLLLQQDSYATAGALPIFAIGEVGKAIFIRNIAFDPAIDWPKFWKDFNDHKRKYRAFLNVSSLLDEKSIYDLVRRPIPRSLLIAANSQHLQNVGPIVDSRLMSFYSHFDEEHGEFIPFRAMQPEITVQVFDWVERGAFLIDWLFLQDLEFGQSEPTSEMAARRERLEALKSSILGAK